MLGSSPVLTAYFNNGFMQVITDMKIGRSTNNDIVLKTDGVSRNHAEILVEEAADDDGNVHKKYFLRDIGSKFGTFV